MKRNSLYDQIPDEPIIFEALIVYFVYERRYVKLNFDFIVFITSIL